MHGIGIAKQVMKVTQDFLVGPDKEYPDIISVFLIDGVHRQIIGKISRGNEIVDFPVGVARYILQCGGSFRFFIQPLNGHDREYLVNGPGVGQGLEQREITEIFIR